MTPVDPAPRRSETSGWRPLAPALAMLAASVILLLGLAVRPPQAGAQAALIFSPGISRDQAMGSLARIDARIVRSGGLDNVVIAYFERPVSWSELRQLGVMLSLDPIVAGGCAPEIAATAYRRPPTRNESNSI